MPPPFSVFILVRITYLVLPIHNMDSRHRLCVDDCFFIGLRVVCVDHHNHLIVADPERPLARNISGCSDCSAVPDVKTLCQLSFDTPDRCRADNPCIVLINKSRADIFAGECDIGNTPLDSTVVNRKKRARSSVLSVLSRSRSLLPFSRSCAKSLLREVYPPPILGMFSICDPNASLASVCDSKVLSVLYR